MDPLEERIQTLYEMLLAMKAGQFSFKIPELDHEHDGVHQLTQAVVELAGDLEKRFQEAEHLARITKKINEGIILDEVLNYVYESFQPIIPYDRLGLSFLEDDGKTVRSYWARSTLATKLRRGFSASLKGSSLQKIMTTGKPRIINDLESYLEKHPDSASTKKIVSEGMRSSLTCPLIAMGKPIGFMFFSSSDRNAYKNVHIEMFQEITDHLSIIVEKSRIYEKMTDITRRLEIQNTFIRKVFGRYVSEDVVNNLLESEDSLRIGGERREITILMSDIRGFSAISERYSAEQTVQLLNGYLEKMVDVIYSLDGTINEILGDSILVIFGAPHTRKDDPERAVACAIEMQKAMANVNKENIKKGYPALSMGIAVNTGEVIVGNIGSEKRAKYGVVGSQVNLTARIESNTLGGQVLVSESTKQKCGKKLVMDMRTDFYAKGFKNAVTAYDILAIKGKYAAVLPSIKQQMEKMNIPMDIDYGFYQGKRPPSRLHGGVIIALSQTSCVILGDISADELSGIRIHIRGHGPGIYNEEIDGKIVEIKTKNGKKFVVHFTYIPPGPADVIGRANRDIRAVIETKSEAESIIDLIK